MNVIYGVIAALGMMWLIGEALSSIFDGPRAHAVRLGRDGFAVLASVIGLTLCSWLFSEYLDVRFALVGVMVGGGFGYWNAWRNGALEDFGVAVVWTSPIPTVVWAAAAVIVTLGAFWSSATAISVGLVGMFMGAVMFVGHYIHAVQVTLSAQQAVLADMTPDPDVCPVCNSLIEAGTHFCSQCGAVTTRYCTHCGQCLDQDGLFCHACGSERRDELPGFPDEEITQRYCYVCSATMLLDAATCGACGEEQPEPCDLCGSPTLMGDAYCGYCAIDLDLATRSRSTGLITEIEGELHSEDGPSR